MPTVSTILAAVNALAPFSLREDWDNCGLLVGDPCAPAGKIGVCLDITVAQIAQAQALGIQCIVSHHPVIFKPEEQKFLAPSPAYLLARTGLAAIAAHTNLDSAEGGVNDVLAGIIGLQNVKPFALPGLNGTLFRGGKLEMPMSASDFARLVGDTLDAYVHYADGGRAIQQVAVCGGGAGEYVGDMARIGYDAYLTGEARHHEFLTARAAGITLLTAGHYETEVPVVAAFAAALRRALPEIEVIVLEEENPVCTAYLEK
ncbi:MAG: Nif3-like dinuclear metal center hexameric protein [Oscillospiraceae bacterium]|nr:Nif3-like dinuclear metal center hexameric protein [Oscillospiraceae bacterium]